MTTSVEKAALLNASSRSSPTGPGIAVADTARTSCISSIVAVVAYALAKIGTIFNWQERHHGASPLHTSTGSNNGGNPQYAENIAKRECSASCLSLLLCDTARVNSFPLSAGERVRVPGHLSAKGWHKSRYTLPYFNIK